MNFEGSKAIGAVVALALLLVVAVAATISFNIWYQEYASGTFGDVETKSNSGDLTNQIIDLIDTNIYVKSGESQNVSYSQIKIGDDFCNLAGELSFGINTLDISSCVYSLSEGENDVVVYTEKSIVSNSFYFEEPTTRTYWTQFEQSEGGTGVFRMLWNVTPDDNTTTLPLFTGPNNFVVFFDEI